MIRLSWLISTGLAIFSVMIIQYFYQMKSETGNLGIIGIAIALPFVLLCLFITYKYFRLLANTQMDMISRIIYLGFGILFIGALIYFAADYKDAVYLELGGTTLDPQSKVYGMRFLNEETSRIYFNFYTISIAIASVAFVSFISGMILGTGKEKELEN